MKTPSKIKNKTLHKLKELQLKKKIIKKNSRIDDD